MRKRKVEEIYSDDSGEAADSDYEIDNSAGGGLRRLSRELNAERCRLYRASLKGDALERYVKELIG